MKAKLRILSILFALTISVGQARADLLTMEITGPLGTATLTNGGSGPVFGLVNATGFTGVLGANLTPSGFDSSLFSTGVIQLTNTLGVPETISIVTLDSNFNAPGAGTLSSTLSVSNLASPTDSVSSFSGIVGGGVTNTITVNAPSGTAVSNPAPFDVSGPTPLFNETSVTLAPGSEATFTITTQATAVPEPGTALFVGSVAAFLFVWRRPGRSVIRMA
jgi:hypothetical protein